MIGAGIDNVTSSGESHSALWRWESDIGNIDNNNLTNIIPSPPPVQDDLPMKTTTMTNATRSDMNAWRGTQGGRIS